MTQATLPAPPPSVVIAAPAPKSTAPDDKSLFAAGYRCYLAADGYITVRKRDGGTYRLFVRGAAVGCTCRGFSSHGHCKHTAEAVDLVFRSNDDLHARGKGRAADRLMQGWGDYTATMQGVRLSWGVTYLYERGAWAESVAGKWEVAA